MTIKAKSKGVAVLLQVHANSRWPQEGGISLCAMLHEGVMIISLFCMLLRPAVGRWLGNKRTIADSNELTPRRRARSVFRSCRKWLAAWLTLHVVILLALARGISSGGGLFAPELDRWQVS